VEIDFDPQVINYVDLLNIFWTSHSASCALPRQYMSAIWYHDDMQRRHAEQTKQQQLNAGRKVVTRLAPAHHFYLAEDYHQKYYLQNEETLFRVLRLDPHNARALADSRAATRLNAYVAGYLPIERLQHELSTFDLSEDAKYVETNRERGGKRERERLVNQPTHHSLRREK
jgi:peptide-methionine (S)-S-oxide reductase